MKQQVPCLDIFFEPFAQELYFLWNEFRDNIVENVVESLHKFNLEVETSHCLMNFSSSSWCVMSVWKPSSDLQTAYSAVSSQILSGEKV